jgi:hypothetical protein
MILACEACWSLKQSARPRRTKDLVRSASPCRLPFNMHAPCYAIYPAGSHDAIGRQCDSELRLKHHTVHVYSACTNVTYLDRDNDQNKGWILLIPSPTIEIVMPVDHRLEVLGAGPCTIIYAQHSSSAACLIYSSCLRDVEIPTPKRPQLGRFPTLHGALHSGLRSISSMSQSSMVDDAADLTRS